MTVLRRIWQWLDDRTGATASIKPLLLHPVPPRLGWWYVFGSATLTAFIVQVATGILLASMYVASPEGAYESLKYVSEVAPLGNLLRGLHYFGASAMILLVFIHMLRVFLMASYKYPREANWISGVVLLLLTLGMGFTGQLLRWDQNAIWSVVVGAEQAGRTPVIGNWLGHLILGGDTLNSATIGHIFSVHAFILPLLIAGVVGLHLYLVLRHGISERPKDGEAVDPATYRGDYRKLLESEGEPFWPVAAWRDIAVGALVVAGVLALAYFIGPPPMGEPPDPTIIQAQPRPDWYFLWYFAVLALLPHGLESYVMILFPLLAIVLLVALPLIFNRGERTLRHRPWAPIFVLCLLAVLVALTQEGSRSPWSPRFDAEPLPGQVIGTSSGPIYEGAQVFNKKGCLYCHAIAGHGGLRGPNLSYIGSRLTRRELIIRIMNGADNMPAFANILTPEELNNLIAFLQTRTEPGEAAATFTPGAHDSR